MEEKPTTTMTSVFLVPLGGGRNIAVPATNVDTLRGGSKGDPQHSCCGNKKISRI